MKRMIILIVAAIVIMTSAVKAKDLWCRWQEDVVHDSLDCECNAPYCYGTGYIEIDYTCNTGWYPNGGYCAGYPCEECIHYYGSPNYEVTYAEPDCAPYPWLDPCPEATCYVEGYDQSTIVWTDIGYCECD